MWFLQDLIQHQTVSLDVFVISIVLSFFQSFGRCACNSLRSLCPGKVEFTHLSTGLSFSVIVDDVSQCSNSLVDLSSFVNAYDILIHKFPSQLIVFQ